MKLKILEEDEFLDLHILFNNNIKSEFFEIHDLVLGNVAIEVMRHKEKLYYEFYISFSTMSWALIVFPDYGFYTKLEDKEILDFIENNLEVFNECVL